MRGISVQGCHMYHGGVGRWAVSYTAHGRTVRGRAVAAILKRKLDSGYLPSVSYELTVLLILIPSNLYILTTFLQAVYGSN